MISFIYEDIWESEMVKDETADCETYLLPYDDLSVQLVNLQVRSILILADALIRKSFEKNQRNKNKTIPQVCKQWKKLVLKICMMTVDKQNVFPFRNQCRSYHKWQNGDAVGQHQETFKSVLK